MEEVKKLADAMVRATERLVAELADARRTISELRAAPADTAELAAARAANEELLEKNRALEQKYLTLEEKITTVLSVLGANFVLGGGGASSSPPEPAGAKRRREPAAGEPAGRAAGSVSGGASMEKRGRFVDVDEPSRFPFALPRGEAPVTTLLSVLQGAHSVGEGIFGFFSTREANTLRLVCGEFRDAVSEARWHDETTRVSGPLEAWRACFPNARAANVAGREYLRDADFARLAGLKALNMSGCRRITGAGLAYLTGIHTLDMRGCTGITDAGLAHLAGIHTLDMRKCDEITDEIGRAHV